MNESKFKTLRHIEAVRNYLNLCIRNILERQESHDQSKLDSPEAEIFDEYTPKLRDCTYGSPEYKQYLKEMSVALEHHYSVSSHHPEHYAHGVNDMGLMDILEMVIDWKASSMRHNDGNLLRSIEINTKRFKMSKQLVSILKNTARWLDEQKVTHKANES
jgi:hypothetical protein